MRLLTAIVSTALLAAAQEAPDPKLHAAAVKLVDASGAKESLRGNIPQLVSQGKAKMLEQFPEYDPAFAEEWAKRMLARLNVEDFVKVAVKAYEKHFTSGELEELIAFQAARKDNKPATLSPELQKKLTTAMPALMGDIAGGCTQVGAKLGGEIGGEIEKEHPEYLKPKRQ